jgi:hypothetical protein
MRLINQDKVEAKIFVIRDQKVMLDSDLAVLYGVPTKRLNEQVNRNSSRFPADFMFRLTPEEAENLRSQIATSSSGYGGRRYLPLAFTEQGVAMLSSVLKSERAVQVNIAIMRVFVRLKALLISRADLSARLKELEQRMDTQDMKTLAILNAIGDLINPKRPPRHRIGFKSPGTKSLKD